MNRRQAKKVVLELLLRALRGPEIAALIRKEQPKDQHRLRAEASILIDEFNRRSSEAAAVVTVELVERPILQLELPGLAP